MHENAGWEGGGERPANEVSRVVQGLLGLYATTRAAGFVLGVEQLLRASQRFRGNER